MAEVIVVSAFATMIGGILYIYRKSMPKCGYCTKCNKHTEIRHLNGKTFRNMKRIKRGNICYCVECKYTFFYNGNRKKLNYYGSLKVINGK